MNEPSPNPLSDAAGLASVGPVPAGFRRVQLGGGFMAQNGPLYACWDGQRVRLGFRVEARHCNPMNICHGGMLATFADMLIPVVNMYQGSSQRRFLPTISLQIDYLSPARLGAWVQGEGSVLRTSRNLLFGQGLVGADGEPVLRASGIFKLGPLIGDGNDPDPLHLGPLA